MSIRKAELMDLDEIIELFSNTVRQVNSRDYSEKQVQVWAEARNEKTWKKKLQTQYFVVKELNNQIIGFSSIDIKGYLDFMYVHADYQNKGIASELLKVILRKASTQQNKVVWTSASITAQPFFMKHGFKEIEKEKKDVKGIQFLNSKMEKRLSSA